MSQPRTIHDFGGFPRELFEVQYPAPGNPALAVDIKQKLSQGEVELDYSEWGLDHGAWSVIKHIYPKPNKSSNRQANRPRKSFPFFP